MRLLALLTLCLAAGAAAAPVRVQLRRAPVLPETRAHHRNRSALLTAQAVDGEANAPAVVPIQNFMDAVRIAGRWRGGAQQAAAAPTCNTHLLCSTQALQQCRCRPRTLSLAAILRRDRAGHAAAVLSGERAAGRARRPPAPAPCGRPAASLLSLPVAAPTGRLARSSTARVHPPQRRPQLRLPGLSGRPPEHPPPSRASPHWCCHPCAPPPALRPPPARSSSTPGPPTCGSPPPSAPTSPSPATCTPSTPPRRAARTRRGGRGRALRPAGPPAGGAGGLRRPHGLCSPGPEPTASRPYRPPLATCAAGGRPRVCHPVRLRPAVRLPVAGGWAGARAALAWLPGTPRRRRRRHRRFPCRRRYGPSAANCPLLVPPAPRLSPPALQRPLQGTPTMRRLLCVARCLFSSPTSRPPPVTPRRTR